MFFIKYGYCHILFSLFLLNTHGVKMIKRSSSKRATFKENLLLTQQVKEFNTKGIKHSIELLDSIDFSDQEQSIDCLLLYSTQVIYFYIEAWQLIQNTLDIQPSSPLIDKYTFRDILDLFETVDEQFNFEERFNVFFQHMYFEFLDNQQLTKEQYTKLKVPFQELSLYILGHNTKHFQTIILAVNRYYKKRISFFLRVLKGISKTKNCHKLVENASNACHSGRRFIKNILLQDQQIKELLNAGIKSQEEITDELNDMPVKSTVILRSHSKTLIE